MILAERAHLGVGGDADNLQDLFIFAAHQQLSADRIGIAEQRARERLIHQRGHGLARAVGNFEIAAAQDRDSENLAKLLSRAHQVSIAG